MESIRNARKEKGWTQQQLADAIGVKRSVISKYESGAVDPPTSQLQAISDALGVSVGLLLGQESERVIIPGRLKIIEINDPDGKFIRYSIKAADEEAFNYGIQILENAGVRISDYTPQALILAALEHLNEDGQQKAVERIQELTEIPKYQRV